MPSIHVCPLSQIESTVHATGARSLITLISAEAEVARPPAIARERHLRLKVSDIVEHMEGCILPNEDHVHQLLDFARRWDRAQPMVIHCFAGVSRSTAAAYITACALHPEQAEQNIAHRLRAASPTATPNGRFIRLADAILGRQGRMVEAITSIGRGVACIEGTAFELPLRRRHGYWREAQVLRRQSVFSRTVTRDVV